MTTHQMLTDVLRREGWPRVTDHPADRGGLTKGGVTFKNYNAWRLEQGQAAVTVDQFMRLNETEARAFFAEALFKPFDFVTDERTRVFLTDWSVTSGPDDPTKALQVCLFSLRLYTGALDGVTGPKTRAAWKLLTDPSVIYSELLQARSDFYFRLAFGADVKAFLQSHPASQLTNLHGWIRRNMEFV